MLNYLKAWMSAFKAGRIAAACKTGCEIDDENEVIIPCFLHREEIMALSAENAKYNEEN